MGTHFSEVSTEHLLAKPGPMLLYPFHEYITGAYAIVA
jgi:hypothetical protein